MRLLDLNSCFMRLMVCLFSCISIFWNIITILRLYIVMELPWNDEGPMLIFVFSLLLDVSRFNALYDACYQVLVTEWNVLKSVGLVSAEEVQKWFLHSIFYYFSVWTCTCKCFIDHLRKSGLVKLHIIWFCYVISSPRQEWWMVIAKAFWISCLRPTLTPILGNWIRRY